MRDRAWRDARSGRKRAASPPEKIPLDLRDAGNQAVTSLLAAATRETRPVGWREPTPSAAVQREFERDSAREHAPLDHAGRMALQRQIDVVQRMSRARSSSTPTLEELEAVPLTDDAQYVSDVFDFFYPNMPYTGGATSDAKRLADAMVRSANQQSRVMDLVPRPGRPTPAYLVKNMLQALYRWAKGKGIYVAVRNEVARQYRRSFDELRSGLPVTLLLPS